MKSGQYIYPVHSCYDRAEELGENYNPDLHYNRAQLLQFEEKWSEAYGSLQKADKYGKCYSNVNRVCFQGQFSCKCLKSS